jgi:AcrR family transcriptional regulator
MTSKPAPQRRSDQTRASILAAARRRFAAEGYAGTTIRAVATDAGIDPSMVMRYYGNKEGLFATAVDIDLRLPDLSSTDPAEIPEILVRHFLARWEGDPTDDALFILLRAAVTHEGAAQRMRDIFTDQVRSALGTDKHPRNALVSCQLLGLALSRYLLKLPDVAALSTQDIVAGLTPAVRATLAS